MRTTPIIVGISGRKQAGKSTLASFISASLYARYLNSKSPELCNHALQAEGTTSIHSAVGSPAFISGTNEPAAPDSILRRINEHRNWNDRPEKLVVGQSSMYDFASSISCATPIKDFAVDVLGLSRESVDGTDEQKNAPTYLKWADIAAPIREKYGKTTGAGFLTGRNVLQVVGTELLREQFYQNIWVEGMLRSIHKKYAASKIVFIPDIRFENEVEAVRAAGGIIIRLTNVPFPQDKHPSETALDNYDFHFINGWTLNNVSRNLSDKNSKANIFVDELWNMMNGIDSSKALIVG